MAPARLADGKEGNYVGGGGDNRVCEVERETVMMIIGNWAGHCRVTWRGRAAPATPGWTGGLGNWQSRETVSPSALWCRWR